MGMYYIGNVFGENSEYAISMKVLAHATLLLNSFIIYVISFKGSEKEIVALIISSLYLISPIHFDVFFFNFQVQALLAESCLLLSYYCYISNKQWGFFLGILCSVLLNTKLSFAIPLICTSNKLTKQQKIMLGVAFAIVWIYLTPQTIEQLNLSYVNSIYSQFQLIIAPMVLSLFDRAILIPKFYSVSTMFLFVVLTLLFLAYSRFYKKDFFPIFLFCISVAAVGAYTPIIRYSYSSEQRFLLLPTLYPTLFLGILFFLLSILTKLKRAQSYLFASVVVASFWFLLNVNIQSMAKNPDDFWQYSLERLPAEYLLKEEIKFKYATFLIDNLKLDQAEVLIREAKDVYPKIEWYHLLIGIEAQKGKNYEIEKLQAELITRKIPYMNSEE